MTGHLVFKGSQTSHFIIKSYFYKSLMTLEGRFSTSLFSASDTMEAVRGRFHFYGMNARLRDSRYIVAK